MCITYLLAAVFVTVHYLSCVLFVCIWRQLWWPEFYYSFVYRVYHLFGSIGGCHNFSIINHLSCVLVIWCIIYLLFGVKRYLSQIVTEVIDRK